MFGDLFYGTFEIKRVKNFEGHVKFCQSIQNGS